MQLLVFILSVLRGNTSLDFIRNREQEEIPVLSLLNPLNCFSDDPLIIPKSSQIVYIKVSQSTQAVRNISENVFIILSSTQHCAKQKLFSVLMDWLSHAEHSRTVVDSWLLLQFVHIKKTAFHHYLNEVETVWWKTPALKQKGPHAQMRSCMQKKTFLTVLQVCVGIKMFCLSALPHVLQSASPKVSQWKLLACETLEGSFRKWKL